MKVSKLTVDPFTNMPILILKDASGSECLPIWIGLIEAGAIASELEQIALDRPMTHDLMKDLVGQCGMKVERIEINDVRDSTFYATIHLCPRAARSTPKGQAAAGAGAKKKHKKMVIVDSRASDAIALAMRTRSRICVARRVIERTRHIDLAARERAARPIMPGEEPDILGDGPHLQDLLETLTDDEFGKWKM